MESKLVDKVVDYQLSSQVDSLDMERSGLVSRNKSENSFSHNTTFSEKDRINLQWKGITYKTENGTTILDGLYGSSNSGELNAIMGPSGSGKTSLVNILSGFVEKRVTGQILVNGVKRELRTFRKITCYILQDDHVLPRFTVRELITFASKLKIPPTVSEKERQKAIDDCIYGLGLVGQQHQKANTLSGGERKRLCIAQEIVHNPPLIFLDEPTSGLDSSSCLQCILLLKTLAEQGKNVICTIHQPSSRIYEIFDNLYMLSDGVCIYRGPTKDLLPHLANQGLKCPKYHSPTDFLTDIAIGLYGEWLVELKEEIKADDSANGNWYDKTESREMPGNEGKNHMTTILSSVRNNVKEILQESWEDIKNNEYPTDNFNQFRVLVERSFLNQLRNPMHMRLQFIGSIVIGLLLGAMFYNTGNDGSKIFSTAGLLFTLMIFLSITAKVPTVLTFPLQRTIFEREHRNGWYSTKMYYLATTFSEIPQKILGPVMSCGLIFWLTGQPFESHRLFFFVLSGILVTLIAESLGLMIGTVADIQNGVHLSLMFTGILQMLSGALLPVKKSHLIFQWLSYFTYSKYGMKTIFLSLYENRAPFQCGSGRCFFKDPNLFLQNMDMNGNILLNYLVMVMLLVFYRLCSFFMLHTIMTMRK